MSDLLTPFIVLALIIVIVIQAVERYFTVRQNEVEKSKLLAAVISKNMNEYTEAVRIEKDVPVKQNETNDEVNLSEASDAAFYKHLGIDPDKNDG